MLLLIETGYTVTNNLKSNLITILVYTSYDILASKSTSTSENQNSFAEINNSFDDMNGRSFTIYVFEIIQLIKHQGFDCTFRDLEFTKEKRKGSICTFCFSCKICGFEEYIHNEDQSVNTNIDVNMTIVSTNVNTGQRYAQLEELAITLNMPFSAPEEAIKWEN